MKARKLLGFAGTLAVLSIALVACGAAQGNAPYKVGILNTAPPFEPVIDGFKDGMAERGYVEGENIIYIYDGPTGEDPEKMLASAQSLVDQDVDLIMTVTNGAAEAAMEATDTVPIVAGVVLAAVESGYAESLAKPGGNFTGVDIGPVFVHRFQFMMEMFPSTERVYIPFQAGYPPAVMAVQSIQGVAGEAGVELVVDEIATPEAVPQTIAEVPEDVDAIFLVPDSIVNANLEPWIELSIERGIPPTHLAMIENGPLLVYGIDQYTNGKQATHHADQILQGADPAEVPIEIGEFQVGINLVTAEAIGYEVPYSILNQADVIIRPDDKG